MEGPAEIYEKKAQGEVVDVYAREERDKRTEMTIEKLYCRWAAVGVGRVYRAMVSVSSVSVR